MNSTDILDINSSRQVNTVIIFAYAATSSKAMIAVGAFLCLDQHDIDNYSKCTTEDLSKKLINSIVYKQYKSKNSTWAEIKTVIDALLVILKKSKPPPKVEVYTDCKTLCDLLSRRKEKLGKSNFMTQAGKIHPNAGLYKELFAIADKFQIQIHKIKGHDYSHRLTIHEKIFAALDRLSRKELRLILDNIVE